MIPGEADRRCPRASRFQQERQTIMKNPLDSISGTIWAGVIITIVLWIIVDGFIF